jgi:GR25 family glycosyltransferase involved in LPS biosynthesis
LESITPILIVAFNRPNKLKLLIDSLREIKPRIIRVSIDGPREGYANDQDKINQCLEYVNEINWTKDIKVYQNSKNLKPRFAIPQAVNTVLSEFEQIIVLEDDVEVSKNTLEFFEWCLDNYKNNSKVGHISGYNNVPVEKFFINKNSHRLSIFPESYAWATWGNRWKLYEDEVDKIDLLKLFEISPRYFENVDKLGKISWSLEKANTSQNYISTWAYRWMFTLWKHQLYSVSPNLNLIRYNGHSEGTHIITKQRWKEIIPNFDYPFKIIDSLIIIPEVEKWSSKNVYRDNFRDLIKLILIAALFRLQRIIRKLTGTIK